MMTNQVLLSAMLAINLNLYGTEVATARSEAAPDWPARPVTMVVPLAAGGLVDVVGRLLASRLSELLGQPVIVENVGGAGGMTGAARVAKASPNGYQFVLGTAGTHAQNQTLYKRPLYNAATDFAPVALVTQQPLLLLARKDLPARNLPEFISYSKANQAKMQYGSSGAGSPPHLACALLNAQPMGFYSPHTLVQDATRHGVKVLTPCVNASARKATLEPQPESAGGVALRLGIGSVRSLGEELAGEGILVSAVAPSVMDTPANRAAQPAADHAKWPTTGEVAQAIAWLASPANALVRSANRLQIENNAHADSIRAR